ncbi:chemotaxis protein CheA [Alcaligenes faecalis subsp. faecalis NCIB 8687]|jgi:two-component system chemotaxis sensor kinase CheA|uniref:chemotaxis protein CheA n=1 Tax=unclassified Alcaligenes TaxID=259357 RepID=UPI000269E4BC|nr:chemotaxis protein CheA [Alcaligenes faecalis subsp. faecalis NCIB 8687]WGQ36694.1 chemotaxis protein CheA [Alcaligenes faecalis]HRK84226.1 chemotaxis protein CheA [Alcaligenes faecalis]
MSSGVDLSQFYETFFDEADELLADMERLLLELDLDEPDRDQLNAIFRAAHSIKGGAGTFGCFGQLAETTHLLENLLDLVRNGEMQLRKDMIDLFLETKDVLTGQVNAYREEQEPDEEAYTRICAQLRQLALEQKGILATDTKGAEAILQAEAEAEPEPEPAANTEGLPLWVSMGPVSDKDAEALQQEMELMGTIVHQTREGDRLDIWVETTGSADDILAVCCFILNADQVSVKPAAAPGQAVTSASTAAPAVVPAAAVVVEPAAPAVAPAAPAPAAAPVAAEPEKTATTVPAAPKAADKPAKAAAPKESGTIRVGVEKVDQIINLVGELVITQAMLVQTASTLDPVVHDRLLNGIEQLERNARDLQESVMSIRMMPMDYVFSRFPRVVRESAARMNKKIRLVTKGQATELDKSLIERIIDPLTHLVRNSIDHGIEMPEDRLAAGKEEEGVLTLSAQHQGGHIIIEVVDDGAGLNRERILKKAMSSGLPVTESMPDDEVWQLIFAPGFSTADKVTEISGRGVGMDVVRRNIQSMGGHVQLYSRAGKGTTTRIVLPLTLAILDGMSVQVGNEVFILPLAHVTESMQPTEEQLRRVTDTDHVMFVRGEYLPLISLRDIFSVEGAETDVTRAIAVILQAEDMRFALLVDHLIGQHQVVVKNLEANYRKIPGISAATILGDGSVALIVDVFALQRLARDPASTWA